MTDPLHRMRGAQAWRTDREHYAEHYADASKARCTATATVTAIAKALNLVTCGVERHGVICTRAQRRLNNP